MKVLLGMSGGVDSSVAALLLKRQGYEVLGCHFIIDGKTPDLSDVDSVTKVLGINYVAVDFSSAFSKNVFEPFIEAYSCGLTPNVCVSCNRHIKFGEFLRYADTLGCDYIATGHYCGKVDTDSGSLLKKAKDQSKDQTYFLNGITGEALSRTLFPLADYTKDEVRAIAEENGLITAHKKGSSDICIAGDKNFSDFLAEYLAERPGNIYSLDGELVGRHRGLQFYTLGQRKGLNLGGKSGEDGRWFVVYKDGATNSLFVSHGDESALMSKKLKIADCNIINARACVRARNNIISCTAKTRYRSIEYVATVTLSGDGSATVEFAEPVRAITKGQYCVLYDGDICLGGGEITEVENSFTLPSGILR